MYPSEAYPTSPEEIAAFVAGQRHGYLLATAPDGFPQVSILPFVKLDDAIEVHCVQGDPTLDAIRVNPRTTFLIADFLAFSPHDWVDPENAARATLHFRAVQYACIATPSTDPEDVAAALRRLLERFEPEATYRPIANESFYGSRLRRLAAVRLQIVGMQAKFKVGPAGPDSLKLAVASQLRVRSEPGDLRAASVIEERAAMRSGNTE